MESRGAALMDFPVARTESSQGGSLCVRQAEGTEFAGGMRCIGPDLDLVHTALLWGFASFLCPSSWQCGTSHRLLLPGRGLN